MSVSQPIWINVAEEIARDHALAYVDAETGERVQGYEPRETVEPFDAEPEPDGVILFDAFSASMALTVWGALSDRNREKLAALPFHAAIRIAWKAYGAASNSQN